VVKGSFKIEGDKLLEGIRNVLSNKIVQGKGGKYDFANGTVFMFERFSARTGSNLSLVVIVDERLFDATAKTLKVHCYALGGKIGIFEMDLYKSERKNVQNFHELIQSFCTGYKWKLHPLQMEK
jgi:hypothetical protein